MDLYNKPYDPRRPVVCLGEYIRKGSCSVFVIVEPLAGKIWAIVSGKRGKVEFSEVLRRIVEEWYPADDFDSISLVMDNLNTHKISSLYEFLEAPRARENISRLDVHFTPIHGSWLNMAEIEIGALMTQSLRRRINSPEMLSEELAACVAIRNREKRTITWEFTCVKARDKMSKHYPKVEKVYTPPKFI